MNTETKWLVGGLGVLAFGVLIWKTRTPGAAPSPSTTPFITPSPFVTPVGYTQPLAVFGWLDRVEWNGSNWDIQVGVLYSDRTTARLGTSLLTWTDPNKPPSITDAEVLHVIASTIQSQNQKRSLTTTTTV